MCGKSAKSFLETMQEEIQKLKADLAAHKRQIKQLWQGDQEMVGLLKSEEYVLVREISRLEQEIRLYRR